MILLLTNLALCRHTRNINWQSLTRMRPTDCPLLRWQWGGYRTGWAVPFPISVFENHTHTCIRTHQVLKNKTHTHAHRVLWVYGFYSRSYRKWKLILIWNLYPSTIYFAVIIRLQTRDILRIYCLKMWNHIHYWLIFCLNGLDWT